MWRALDPALPPDFSAITGKGGQKGLMTVRAQDDLMIAVRINASRTSGRTPDLQQKIKNTILCSEYVYVTKGEEV